MSLRVLLAQHYPLALEALKSLLEGHGLQVTAEPEAQTASRRAGEIQPDVVLLDMELIWREGLQSIQEIRAASPNTKVIVLSQRTEEHWVREALEAGVQGYVLKNKNPEDLIRAITEVANGRPCFSPEVARSALHPEAGCYRRGKDLTGREREVVKLVAEGHSTREVAARLGISIKTADCHRTRIMEKLNLHQTASLVRYAVRQGLVQP